MCQMQGFLVVNYEYTDKMTKLIIFVLLFLLRKWHVIFSVALISDDYSFVLVDFTAAQRSTGHIAP